MRYSYRALTERIRSARRRRDRKRFRNNSYHARVENLEERDLLALTVGFGFFGVPENSPVDRTVGTVSASGGTGTLTYAITAGNTSIDGDANLPFKINSSTGRISVNDPGDLDFEQQANFVLTASVTDSLTTKSNFQVVTISDVAENIAPVIANPGAISIGENIANGSVVATISATDADGDSLTYSLPGAGNIDGPDDDNAEGPDDEIRPFAIHPTTGVITIADTDDINFEGGFPNPFNLLVRVTDNGQGSFSSERVVPIAVEDQNAAPVVPSQTYTIAENTGNSTPVGFLAASDEDAGQTITYSLTANPANDVDGDGRAPFRIDANSGLIRVNDSGDINFEARPSFTVSVTVTDNNTDPGDPDPVANPASTTTTFRVNLLNVIVNLRPVIAEQDFSVSEDASNGTSVGTVVASDADAGQTLTYSIVGGNTGDADIDEDGNGPFAINAATGVITVNDADDLDNDNEDVELTVRVTDNGEDNLFAQALVTISVVDVNDPPVAEDQSVAVQEHANVGQLVGDPLVASDPNDNALIFTIEGQTPGSGTFEIDSETGQIVVADNSLLDFEVNESFELDVLIEDDADDPQSVSITVTVLVQNFLENNAPVVPDMTFPTTAGSTYEENRSVGFSIGTMTFTDDLFPGQAPDGPHTFSIESGNVGDAFEIHPTTGEITVKTSSGMDFETTPVFELEIGVTDSGEGEITGTGTATINLRDGNDAPVIAEGQLALINENAAIGDPALEIVFLSNFFVAASDQDAGDTWNYAIVSQTGVSQDTMTDVGPSGDDLGAFSIDPGTGQIFSANPAKHDFDALVDLTGFDPDDGDENLPSVHVELGVTATDGDGATSAVQIVTVAIRNIDDNTDPIGQVQQGFSFDIADDGEIEADGVPETDPFAALSSNESEGSCIAQLSPDHTSLAFVGCSTNSDEDGTAFIRADNPATGDILVSDIPVTDGDLLFVWTQLTTVPNPDAGEEGEPATLPAPFDDFALRELLEDNTLYLVLDLPDGEIAGQIRLNPNGTDAFVMDENADGFNNIVSDGEEREVDGETVGAGVDHLVGTVTASDAEGYDLSYEILSGNPDLDGANGPAFYINDAGEIRVNDASDLDADVMPQINLTIGITDDPVVPDFPVGHVSFAFGETAQSTTTTVEINLRDLNDKPQVPAGQQFGSVLENSRYPTSDPAGITRVGDPVRASDGDGDTLTYSIISQTPAADFAINSETGQISVAGPIDFETEPSFALFINVSDGAESATVVFLVLVLNQPENEAPAAPDNINAAEPQLGGLSFDLDREQTVPLITEAAHPGTSGSCTYSFEPLTMSFDGSESGSFSIVCTHDVATATAAHIHHGSAGVAGPVVVGFSAGTSPLALSIDETFESAELADFAAFQTALLAGDLYVNVHSTGFGAGEIRGQITAPAQDQLILSEDAADGTSVGTYEGATDPDLPLKYSISGGNLDLDGDGQMAFSIDESTAEITVNDTDDLNYEAIDKIFLDISVTDSPALDEVATGVGRQQITLLDANDAPSLAPIFNLFSPLDVLTIDINGVDVNTSQEFIDSTFTKISVETEGVAPPAVDTDAILALDLFVDGGLFPNFFGSGEKWLRAAPSGPSMTMDWYYILPTGELFRWDENAGGLQGESQGFFGVAAHLDPVANIVNVTDADDYPLPTAVELTINMDETGFAIGEDDPANRFTITRIDGAGTATVTVQVCDSIDGSLCDVDSFQVIYGENQVPVLDPIGAQTSAAAADEIVVPLSATDPNPGASLTFSVALSSVEFDLDQEFNFRVDGSDFFNALGSNERWVRSSVNGQWYFVLPNNELHRWDKTSTATGPLVSQLNAGVYSNINRLTNPSAAVAAEAEIVDDVLTITKDPGFVGFFNATVTVNDGADTDSEKFRVTFI